MKKILLSAVLAIALVSCKESNSTPVYVQDAAPAQSVVVTPANQNVGDNLDLQALGDLVKQSASAQDIENKLNTDGSINNLDLDGDGQVDYVKVNETQQGANKGFVFLVDTQGTPQQVAVITIEQANGVAQVNVQGNQAIYGPQAYYTSSHALSDLLIMNYLLSYHRPYYSPYHYGYYPSHYRSYRSVPYSSYRNSRVVSRTTTTRTVSRPATRNSSYGNSSYKSRPVTSATNRTSNLSRPTSSQKSFKVTSPAKSRPVTSGFGSKKNSSYGSSSSSRPSSYGSGSSRRSSNSYGSSSSSSRPSSYRSSSSSKSSSSFGSSSRSSSSRSSSSSSSRSSRSSRR